LVRGRIEEGLSLDRDIMGFACGHGEQGAVSKQTHHQLG